MMTQGTLADATIIQSPSSTKNNKNERDPDMHKIKKAMNGTSVWKLPLAWMQRVAWPICRWPPPPMNMTWTSWKICCMATRNSSLVILVIKGAEKREELKDTNVEWLRAERPGKVRALKKHPRKNKIAINIEYLKASMRTKVEHPFRIIKCQFGFIKARYKGLTKNDSQLAMRFILANLFKVDQMLRRQPRSVWNPGTARDSVEIWPKAAAYWTYLNA